MRCRATRLLALPLFLPLPLAAQASEVAVREGDSAAGIGQIVVLGRSAVSDAGAILFEANGSAPSPGNRGIYRDEDLIARRGDPFGAGLFESAFDLGSNGKGDLVLAALLSNTPGAPLDNEILSWNDQVLLVESDPASCACSAGTVYHGFDAVHAENDGTLLVSGQVRDPGPSGIRDFLLRLTTDTAGTVLGEEFLLLEGDLAASGEIVTRVTAQSSQFALADDGNWLSVARLGTDSLRDDVLLLKGVPIAREGEPSVVPGRIYASLSGSKVDINDSGQHVFIAFLQGDVDSNAILVKDGAVFAHEGQPLVPGVSDRLERFDAAPVRIAGSGDLFWYGNTYGPASSDQYLLRNHQVVIQEGVTQVGADTVTAIVSTRDSFDASEDGRFLLAQVELAGGIEAFVLVDFGTVVPVPGCSGNAGSLARVGGDARPGETLRFELTDAQAIGAIPVLLWSTEPAVAGSACGLPSRIGEILVDLGSVANRIVGSPWAGGAVALDLALPQDLALVNLDFYGQAAFVDPLGAPVRLTNGLRVEVGAP